jgi:hypothetical protein
LICSSFLESSHPNEKWFRRRESLASTANVPWSNTRWSEWTPPEMYN